MGDPDRGNGRDREWLHDEAVRRRWGQRALDGKGFQVYAPAPPPDPEPSAAHGRSLRGVVFPVAAMEKVRAGLSASAVVVLLFLLLLPRDRHGLSDLCYYTGLSRKTVVRALDELEAAWLISARLYDGGSGRRWYEYIGP